MYRNFSCYHSLYGFVVGTQMVLQALWEFPIQGTENILSMVIRSLYSQLIYKFSDNVSCLINTTNFYGLLTPAVSIEGGKTKDSMPYIDYSIRVYLTFTDLVARVY